jgi:hypothetical protein
MTNILLAIIVIGMFLFGLFVVNHYSKYIRKNSKGSCREKDTEDWH